MSIKVHCIEKATIHDIEDSNVMIDKFADMETYVEELRNTADAAALLVYDMDACGIGYLGG